MAEQLGGNGNGNGSGAPRWLAVVLRAAETWGIPTVILLLAGWWFATNVAEPLVRSHAGFLTQQIAITTQQAKLLDDLQTLVRTNQGILKKAEEDHEMQAQKHAAQLQALQRIGERIGAGSTPRPPG